MKRLIYIVVIIEIIFGCGIIIAQPGVNIYKKDGSIIYISFDDISHIDILGEEDELWDKVEEGDIPNSIFISNNIRNLKGGDYLHATAFVTAKCLKGLILTDKGGSILYYNPEIDLDQFPENTVVEVEGYIREIDRGLQLTQDAKINVIGEKIYSYPSPEELTGEIIDKICDSNNLIETKYISLRGVIQKDGDACYLEFEGTDHWGKIFLPFENEDDYDIGNKSIYEFLKRYLNTYMPEGCQIFFKGYPINYNNDKFNILITYILIDLRNTNNLYTNNSKYIHNPKRIPLILTVADRCAIPLKINENEGYLSSRKINKVWIDDIEATPGIIPNAWNCYVTYRYEFTLSPYDSINNINYYTVKDQYGRYMNSDCSDGKLKFITDPKLINGHLDDSYLFSLEQNERGDYMIQSKSEEPKILYYSKPDQCFKLIKMSEINETYEPLEVLFSTAYAIDFD